MSKTYEAESRQFRRKLIIRNLTIVCAGVMVLILGLFISTSIGFSKMSFYETLQTLVGKGTESQTLVVFSFRLPRILIAAFIGMGLAVSGCILQGMTQNPLADPGLLGITAGGGLAIVLYALYAQNGMMSIFTLPILAMMGSGLAATLVYVLANRRKVGISSLRLILTGIAIQAGLSALTTVLVLKLDETQYGFVASWQAGMIWGANWNYVLTVLPWFLVFLPYVLWNAKTLDALVLGHELATGLGVNVAKAQKQFMVSAVCLAACSVAVGGHIGFVGLIAPHMARHLVGPRHQVLLPVSALMGASLVTLADALARMLIQPNGLPTGIVTAAIGAPYFIYMLVKTK